MTSAYPTTPAASRLALQSTTPLLPPPPSSTRPVTRRRLMQLTTPHAKHSRQQNSGATNAGRTPARQTGARRAGGEGAIGKGNGNLKGVATPRTGRRKSFFPQRETPRDILRTLSRVLAPKTKPLDFSTPDNANAKRKLRAESERLISARKVLEHMQEDDDDLTIKPPRLSNAADGDDSFYLSKEANPVSRLPFGTRDTNRRSGQIQPRTPNRISNFGTGDDDFANASMMSFGKSPEGARRMIPNSRASFGEFRLGEFDISELGLGPQATANLSGVFDRLGEVRAKAAFNEIDTLQDGDVPTRDAQDLLDSVTVAQDEDEDEEDDTLHVIRPNFDDDDDGMPPTFQFTIPDQYEGRPSLDRIDEDEDDENTHREGSVLHTISRANSSVLDESLVQDTRFKVSGMGSIASPDLGDQDMDDDYTTTEGFELPPMPVTPAAYTPAADLSFSTLTTASRTLHRSISHTTPSLRLQTPNNQTEVTEMGDVTTATLPEIPITPFKQRRLSRLGLPLPALPRPVIKRLATMFLQRTTAGAGGTSRLSADTVEALAVATDWFFEQAAEDLSAYASHAGRKSIDESDVVLLMARQRKISTTYPSSGTTASSSSSSIPTTSNNADPVGENGGPASSSTTTNLSFGGGSSLFSSVRRPTKMKTVFALANELLPRELVRFVKGEKMKEKQKKKKKTMTGGSSVSKVGVMKRVSTGRRVGTIGAGGRGNSSRSRVGGGTIRTAGKNAVSRETVEEEEYEDEQEDGEEEDEEGDDSDVDDGAD